MSQRDLIAELRGARAPAPAEVRERVRAIAAGDETARTPRFTWRRALVVALPVAAAVAATVVFTRPGGERATLVERQAGGGATRTFPTATADTVHAPTPRGLGKAAGARAAALAPLSAPGRLQQVEATLSLRVAAASGVSQAMQRALRIARSYGGFPLYVDAGTQGKRASADVTLKVPRSHLREAMARLSALGTITAEHLDVQDVTAGVNETDRAIVRLQAKLAELRRQEQTTAVQRTIAQLTATVARLQRQRAQTIRAAHYATVSLHLATREQVLTHHKVHHGPLHRLGTALMWLGVGAVYLLVLGTPVVLVIVLAWLAARLVRRRREEALLSQP
jgi:hypothetical protein